MPKPPKKAAPPPEPKPYVWRYLIEGGVRHALERYVLSLKEQRSMCGVTPVWYLPSQALWQDDWETLTKRRPCRSCIARLKAQGYE